jgi:hypothetical protein
MLIQHMFYSFTSLNTHLRTKINYGKFLSNGHNLLQAYVLVDGFLYYYYF